MRIDIYHHSSEKAPSWAVELKELMEKMMAAIDDLKAEVATVASDVLAAIDKFTSSLPPSQDPAIVQATADLKAAVKPLEDFVNPPAPPTT